ncbi:hypothetical protein SKAU_G00040070 [Synaphobranchus kaupii]|uniref:G-protein coupled receptors family 1 profile domain-containing protein n=1 Tax=Synaphobranchus kaupii TaxID=118154 RepID=A0A9Q1GHG0_SYNKA|nr:hypothetical protein SKAU_G00040070 [Synaphobranchus kaupii]
MNEKVLLVQVLVGIFLYVNCFMIFTFFKKEAFCSNVRYILFAHILFCDSLLLFLTNILLLLSHYRVLMPVRLCLCFYMVMSSLKYATPLTLMAMSFERYVAICIPLRHAEISTPSKAIRCLPVIHALSSIQLTIITSVFIATVPLSFYMTDRMCNAELFIVHKWQGYLRHQRVHMSKNGTAQNGSIGSSPTLRQVTEKVLILQVLVGIFLSVNCLMIFTFFKKEAFRNDVRYILFVHTLFCDSLFLFLTNILLFLSRSRVLMPVGLCLCFYVVMSILTFSTPLTLMAMSLERYVAICIPLRHAEISTPSKAIRCLPVIHALSSIQLIIFTSVLISTVPLSFYTNKKLCNVQIFIVHKWQGYLRSAILELYFLVMSIVIVFTYVKIMGAAKLALTDNKKSASKGLRTVALHGIQLFLCLVQLWCPFVEMAVLEIDLDLFINGYTSKINTQSAAVVQRTKVQARAPVLPDPSMAGALRE